MSKINKNKKQIILVGILIALAVLFSNNKVIEIFSKIISAITPILAAFAIAFFMRPLIKLIQKNFFKKETQKFIGSTITSYLIVIILVFVFFKWLSGPVYHDAWELWENISSKQFVTLLSEKVDSLFRTNSFSFINTIATEIEKWWNTNLKNVLISSAGKTSAFILKTAYVLAVSIYISIDYKFIRQWIINHSKKSAKKTTKILEEINSGITAWGQGWIKDQAFIFTCTLITLWALGISSFLTLSIIMTLFNFIPFIGPIIGGIVVWIYIVAIHVGMPGTYVLNLFFVDSEIIILLSFFALGAIQTIESLWWIPKVYSEKVSVKPLTILVSLSVISTVISPFFSPLTIPIIVIVKILYKNYFAKK